MGFRKKCFPKLFAVMLFQLSRLSKERKKPSKTSLYVRVAAASDIKIKYTNCTTEENSKIYRINKPIDNNFYDFFIPFGKVSKELGRKLINETLVLDLNTKMPILSIQPFKQEGYEYSIKIKTLNVKDHDGLQRMVSYQIRKYNACRRPIPPSGDLMLE